MLIYNLLVWIILNLHGGSDLIDQKQIKEIIKETLEDIDLYSSNDSL